MTLTDWAWLGALVFVIAYFALPSLLDLLGTPLLWLRRKRGARERGKEPPMGDGDGA